MATNTYQLGNVVRCSNDPTKGGTAFTTNGVKVDPTVVKFVCVKGDGTTIRYTYGVDAQLVRDSVGVYHADITADVPGNYIYRFYSTGSGQAADQRVFVVQDGAVS